MNGWAGERISAATGEYGEFAGEESDRVVFGTYCRTGTWSPQLVSLLAGPLLGARAGTLLDVGANIGLIAIAVAQRSRASCLAFEPAPLNARLLAHNVARHGLCDRIEIHEVALDARPGAVMLELSADNSGDHRIASATARGIAPGSAEREGAGARLRGPAGALSRVRVRAERLDDLLAGRRLARPCILKLDTQGCEARVLRGAARTLAEIDALVVEYWPAGLLRAGDSAEALHGLLGAFPYAAVLGPLGAGALQPTPDALASLAWVPTDGSDEGFLDLLLARDRSLALPAASGG